MDKNKLALAASAATAVGLIYVNMKLNWTLKKTSQLCMMAGEVMAMANQAAIDYEFANIVNHIDE